MCLITFAYKQNPEYRLILAANRDEFFERPTREARFWEEEGHPELLAGKDLRAGGTWMGVHKKGRWGAITNYRDLNDLKSDPPSRGNIIPAFLRSDKSAEQFLESHRKSAHEYNGYNVLLSDQEDLFYFSNQHLKMNRLDPGIYGLSNAYLDTPWPKVERAKEKLRSAIDTTNPNKEDLFDLLISEDKADDDALPDTGLNKEWEKALSSVFISIDGYGTRCSSLLLIDHSGNLSFTERRYKKGSSDILSEQQFDLEGF